MAGKITEIHRKNVPGLGRRLAEPVLLLAKNSKRQSVTLNVCDLSNGRGVPQRLYIGYEAEGLNTDTGYPVLSSDGDLYLTTTEAIFGYNPSNEDVIVRITTTE